MNFAFASSLYRLAAVLTLAHAGAIALLWPLPPAAQATAAAAMALCLASARAGRLS